MATEEERAKLQALESQLQQMEERLQRCAQAEEEAQKDARAASAKADGAKSESDKAKGMMDTARNSCERSMREAAEAQQEGEQLRIQAAQSKKDFETLQVALQSWLGVEQSLQAAEAKKAAAEDACKSTKEARSQQLATIMRSTLSEAAAPAAPEHAAPPPFRMQVGGKKKNKVR